MIPAASDWGTGDLAPGGTASHTFGLGGVYPYYDGHNPAQRGWVVVVPPVPAPDFQLTGNPTTGAVVQGQAWTVALTVTALNGFTAPVWLGVSGLPAGVAAGWSANPLTPTASALLTLSAGSQAPAGSYTLVVNSAGGGFSHTTPISLSVVLHAGFTVSITPTSQFIAQSSQASYTATVAGLYDFTEPVTLTVSGAPAGVTAAVAPNPVVPTGTATIAVTTSLSTPATNHTLALTASGGGRVHSLPFTLSVTPHPDFDLAVTPNPLT